jgi:hypothetical protein
MSMAGVVKLLMGGPLQLGKAGIEWPSTIVTTAERFLAGSERTSLATSAEATHTRTIATPPLIRTISFSRAPAPQAYHGSGPVRRVWEEVKIVDGYLIHEVNQWRRNQECR